MNLIYKYYHVPLSHVPRWGKVGPGDAPSGAQSNVMMLHFMIHVHCSVLTRTFGPGDSPSALRFPSTESGVLVRACGVDARGAGPSLVTSA